jgi:hypothetical protein
MTSMRPSCAVENSERGKLFFFKAAYDGKVSLRSLYL